MLGNAFVQSQSSNEYYLLMFNSIDPLPGNVMVEIGKLLTTCSSLSFADPLVTTVYKCRVNTLLNGGKNRMVNYSIIHERSIVNGTEDKAKISVNRTTLFEGTFKVVPQVGDVKLLFLGNWQTGTVNWTESVLGVVSGDEKLCLVASTGDFLPGMSA
jgi:hypothetical protein